MNGSTIKAKRKKHGMTRKDMAQKLHMPPSTLKGYETGKRRIPGLFWVALRTLDDAERPA